MAQSIARKQDAARLFAGFHAINDVGVAAEPLEDFVHKVVPSTLEVRQQIFEITLETRISELLDKATRDPDLWIPFEAYHRSSTVFLRLAGISLAVASAVEAAAPSGDVTAWTDWERLDEHSLATLAFWVVSSNSQRARGSSLPLTSAQKRGALYLRTIGWKPARIHQEVVPDRTSGAIRAAIKRGKRDLAHAGRWLRRPTIRCPLILIDALLSRRTSLDGMSELGAALAMLRRAIATK